MKIHNTTALLTLLALAAGACSDGLTPPVGDGGIRLAAKVEGQTPSRSPYRPDGSQSGMPTPSTPLGVEIWATTEANRYQHRTNEDGVPYNGSFGKEVFFHTGAHFQSGDAQLLDDAVYPRPDEGERIDVNFVGLHPIGIWSHPRENGGEDYSGATAAFTGCEDVMLGPEIQGSYGMDYAANPHLIPTFRFCHLLTCLQVRMGAELDSDSRQEKEDASEAWGKILSMTVRSRSRATLRRLSSITRENLASGVTFSEETDLDFHRIGQDGVFPAEGGFAIPTEKTDAAYVLCAPVQARKGEEEYVIRIRTEKREVEIPVDLMEGEGIAEEDFTMGRWYTLLLNFRMGDIISLKAEISLEGRTDWYVHGTGSFDIQEENIRQ